MVSSITMHRVIVASTLLPLFLAACGPQPAMPLDNPAQVEAADMTSAASSSVGAAAQQGRLTRSALLNAEYHSPDWGNFQLIDGTYHRPPLNPGESPETYVTQLREPVIYGDLNADGVDDAAVFLSTQNGGTGHFVELAAMLNHDGAPENVATVSLGDRQAAEGGRIEEGVIALEMRVHGPNDALCCPSQLETWRFRLENGQLVRLP